MSSTPPSTGIIAARADFDEIIDESSVATENTSIDTPINSSNNDGDTDNSIVGDDGENNDDDDDSVQDEKTTATLLLEDPDVRRKIEEITSGKFPLKEPPMPTLPKIDLNGKMTTNLKNIQKFINVFEYNHTGQTFFKMKRDRGMKHLTNVAKEIIRDALPIQCVEGVFLGAYLTNELKTITRIPVSFKSEVEGTIYRHIVLAVESEGKWGALGISRRKTLMYKDLKFDSLGDLMREFRDSYQESFHELLKIYVGLPFTRDTYSSSKLQWRVLKIALQDRDWAANSKLFNSYSKDCGGFMEYYSYTGTLPPNLTEEYRRGHSDLSRGKMMLSSSFLKIKKKKKKAAVEKKANDNDNTVEEKQG